jgi:hypothetical protein
MSDVRDLKKFGVGDVFFDWVLPWFVRCRPRILIVTDGALNYQASGPIAHFGLTRLVQAISQSTLQPIITLAHRGFSASPVNVYGPSFPVLTNFNFNTAATAITIANYDQIWMFGFDSGALPAAEVKRIADFMNAGGGVFSTGDHATLGRAMGGQLPRIRHMREWVSIPMGAEPQPVAVNAPDPRNRIDTVVDPGLNQLYEFEDQSDEIPQRIYPNYDVTWPTSTSWSATLHALLRLPGAVINRTDNTGFVNDIDVLPDHPHESVCYAISATANPIAFNGMYNVASVGTFQEFPNAASGTGRIGSKIVAYGVSGGRSVLNNVWKPPVNPRMFGIISAFDGHAAAPYAPLTTRPGRIVCDSTWHHFVNINLDGTNTSNPPRNGLGFGSGVNFMPSIPLQKIYNYYRNIVDWLQPANRILCWVLPHFLWLRFHPAMIEELVDVPRFKEPRDFEGLGLEAMRLIDSAYGAGTAADSLVAALRLDPATAAIADSPEAAAAMTGPDRDGNLFFAFIAGKALAYVADAIPPDRPDQLEKLVGGDRHERLEQALAQTVTKAAGEALGIQLERTEARLRTLTTLKTPRTKSIKGS